jgi:hypothetical protein
MCCGVDGVLGGAGVVSQPGLLGWHSSVAELGIAAIAEQNAFVS